MVNILAFLLLLLNRIQTKDNDLKKDKDSLIIYDKLNNLETVIENQDFIINTKEKSYAYFDSFDRNAIFWISKSYEDLISNKSERITGQFYQIEPKTTYYVRNLFWKFPSVLKKYLYPMNLEDREIIINDDEEEINFLYLEKNKSYVLNFEKNKIKKMIKLSHKTLNSKVKILINDAEEGELNQKEHYYQIKEDFKEKIKLEISENNALIEFLSDIGDYKIFKDIDYAKNEVDKNILIINIPKTQKIFELLLFSDEPFNSSFSYGLSNNSNYYYYSRNNTKINASFNDEDNNYQQYINLNEAFKDLIFSKNEFISLAIILWRASNQKIFLKYRQIHSSPSLGALLDEEISEQYCTKIIENLKNIFELYVFTDIAKNPPNFPDYPNYHHKAIDLKEELDKVSKINRTFYEFYQEIQKILTSTKDLHLQIFANETPKGIKFSTYRATLPFNFEIRKDARGKYKIFIIKNIHFGKASAEDKYQIESHLEIPLKKINDIDPFEYIQNWSKYRQTKNQHAQFTYIINEITNFNLNYFPIDSYDLDNNEYEFEDNSLIRFSYHLDCPTLGENDAELYNYFLKVVKNQNAYSEIPSFDDIKDEFLAFKGLKQKKINLKNEKNEKIKWDILYDETENGFHKYFKCRYDEKNKVNVLIQNSFNLNFFNTSEKALDCARLFYSNEYPLIIIQDNNGGGILNLAQLMNQILQIRIANRRYESFRLSDISKKFFNSVDWGKEVFVDMESCKSIKSFNDINETIDHYNYSNLNIEHKRTKMVDRFSRNYRNALNNFREEYFNSTFIKKPTDIIIFTDSYSYSSTSGFIKGFQSTGGAIVVGYNGNPTKNGTDLFDASQSHSSIQTFENTEIKKNFEELGFSIISVACGEFYDDLKVDNPIPREYTINPVDYRVDIYSRYSDDIYEKFIKEGLEVHNLFNNGSYCNAKNERLLLHDENCRIIKGDKYAHGGYKCNNENKWDKGKCEPYYCDIGYYYDRIDKKCKEECPFDVNKKYFIIHEKKYNKTFMIEPNMTYTFETFNNDNFYYFIETSEESINSDPKLIFITSYQYEDIWNNKNKTIQIKIRSVDPNLNPGIKNVAKNVESLEINEISFLKGKYMYFVQSLDDSSFYIKNLLSSKKGELKLAKYNSNMEYEDIIQINDKFFSDISDDILLLEKSQLYIIYFDFKEYEEINFYFTRKYNEIIKMSNSNNILFLEKNKEYSLDFSDNNLKNIMIKLSRKTLNSELTLIDENIKLNSKNLYYPLKENFKEKLKVKTGNENVLIEILVKQEDNLTEIVNLDGKTKLNINKEFTFIQIPKNYNCKDLSFKFNKEGDSIIYIYHDYSKEGYSLYYQINEEDNKIILNNFTFNINEAYKEDINLMENEFYYLFIQTKGSDSNINIDVEIKDNESKNKDKDKEDNGLQTWHIILIILGAIIFLLLIFILIICLRRRNKITDDKIEDKMQNLTEIQE